MPPALLVLAALVLLAACARPPDLPSVPRPVRVARVEAVDVREAFTYAGEVTPRRETVLSFRVGGKIASRLVEVGDPVRKGQAIARLDPADAKLAVDGLRAQLTAARADFAFADDDLRRYRELLAQNIIAPPEFDRHRTAHTAAKERVSALEAQVRQSTNQLRYTELTADRDGVIAGFSVEAGAVVGAGQPVARLAQTDEKEITLHVPEQRSGEFQLGRPVEIALWAFGERPFRGSVREIAPVADPQTRSFRVRVSLLEGNALARLGMTATVRLPIEGPRALAIPRSAVFSAHDQGPRVQVWRVEGDSVRATPVTLGKPVDGERVEVVGLADGDTVVRAGVQRLIEGQSVRIVGDRAVRRQP